MKTFNQCLYEKRIEKGLSLRQAAKKIGVPRFVLQNAERGYYPLSKKHLKKASELYDFNFEKIFERTYAYTNNVSSSKKKSIDFFKVIYKISQHFLTRIIVALLLIVSLASMGVHFFYRNKAIYEPTFYISNSFLTIHSNVIAQGEETTPYHFNYTKNITDGSNTIGTVDFTVYDNIDPVSNFYFIGTYIISPTQTFTLINYSSAMLGDYYITFHYLSDSIRYSGTILRSGETNISPIKYYYSTNFIDNIPVFPGSSTYRIINSIVLTYFQQTDNVIKKGFENFNVNESVYSVVNGAINAEQKIIKQKLLLPLYLSLALSFFFLVLSVFTFAEPIKRFFNKKAKSNVLQDRCLMEAPQIAPKQKLPRDWKIFPPIKESWEQIIGLIALFLGGIGIVLTVCMILNIWNVPRTDDMRWIANFLLEFLPISVLLLLYTKLDIYSKNNNIMRSALMFIFFGLVFYALQILTIIALINDPSMTKEVAEVLLNVIIPGNFFFSLAVYAIFAMFLFTTPKKCNTKKKIMWWRAGCIIPILYFIIGYLLTYSDEIFNFEISPYFECLFFSKNITITLFVCGSLAIKFFMQKRAYSQYGKEKGRIYLTGNRYAMQHNLYHAILLLCLAIIDVVLPYFIPGMGNFGFQSSSLLFLLVPLILFGSHRKEKRSFTWDTSYIISYSILSFLPYFICIIAALQKLMGVIF